MASSQYDKLFAISSTDLAKAMKKIAKEMIKANEALQKNLQKPRPAPEEVQVVQERPEDFVIQPDVFVVDEAPTTETEAVQLSTVPALHLGQEEG